MPEHTVAGTDWATTRRRRWSTSRIAAAVLLHLLVLTALKLAIDRVELPRRGAERSTTLIEVALGPLAGPPPHPVKANVAPARARAPIARPPAADRSPAPSARFPHPPTDSTPPRAIAAKITPRVEPESAPAAVATSAASPASAASSLRDILDSPATRMAIREAGRRPLLSERAAAATGLPLPVGANERLATGIEAAHKGDCMKGEYLGGGMGLLSVPFLLAAEAMGSCAHKL